MALFDPTTPATWPYEVRDAVLTATYVTALLVADLVTDLLVAAPDRALDLAEAAVLDLAASLDAIPAGQSLAALADADSTA
ncbi:hypothetical protein [Rhodococcus sp. MEB041]|uniref:hypothetical protein n=1 Tax=Rhodococcus sp. MEB041 TaxID=3040323 RepID=UPI00254E95A5|nr:hypothetical protein [Rhodococcus sp. MEB041]